MTNLKGKFIETFLQSGIFGIVNYRNKSIYIGYSNNILEAVTRIVTEVKDGVHACIPSTQKLQNLNIIIIETCTKDELKVKQSYWVEQYRNMGYKILNVRKPLTYRTRIRIDEDYNVLAELVNARKDSIIIGVFKKVQEAVDFIEEVKKNTPIRPIYAQNQLTEQYVQKKSYNSNIAEDFRKRGLK